jgi:hypothetical protein
MKKKLLSARFWHKWSGIVAAVWLLVLGFTGFMIDHREWHWLWHSTVSESWIPERVVKNARSSVVRVMRINPQNPDQQLAGGERGFWHLHRWQRQQDNSNGTKLTAMQNVGKNWVRGIETAYQVNDFFIKGFDLQGNLTFTQSKVTDNPSNSSYVGRPLAIPK